MEHPNLFEKHDGDAASFALADFSAKLAKERLDIPPLDVGAGRVGEDCFKRALMLSLHVLMVPKTGTADRTGESPRLCPR
jgi:hypothetical protein